MKRILLAIFAVFTFSNLIAQEYRIIKGGVTDSLPIPSSGTDTYAIYTPSDYTPRKNGQLYLFLIQRVEGQPPQIYLGQLLKIRNILSLLPI